ncbi:MAG: adenylate/guanylate cyclase domain-containing protein [Brachybacterium paraconglomeratum]|nr:adenylate/guanylate cyclase domain-containing protein [Brachybacterium paraconglomeratum]
MGTSGQDGDLAAAPAGPRLAGLVSRLADLGGHAGLTRDERLRAGTLVLASVLIALLASVWVGTYLALGHVRSAAIPALYQVVTAVGLLVLVRTRRFDRFRRTQLLTMLVLPALLQASLGGFVASSGMILWALFVPLAALALGLRPSAVWLTAYLAEVVVLALLDPFLTRYAVDLPRDLATWFFVLNIVGVTVCAFVMLAYFVEQRARVHRALEVERERSERLLLNVLPAPIAARLKTTTDVIAERHESVSVLFADLVGFTEHAGAMAPEDLVALLDRIFSGFDRRAEVEGVEKIKTIGDAYMVVAGAPDPRPGHVQALARLALAMREELDAVATETGQDWLQVRIGIDTGPVVAGVIGRHRFSYDLWGDTVNTASRVQSLALPGQVQVTARAAAALRDDFDLRPRGRLEVKGKGTMETFLLQGARVS